MKNILFICCLLVCSSGVFATEKAAVNECAVTGTIIDAVTRRPMADVIVTARGIDSNSEIKVMSDETGQYRMQGLPAGTYSFKFQKENYRQVEKKPLQIKKGASKFNVELMQEDGVQEYHLNWLLKSELI